MTLNTFHLAGSGANVTLGIPRLREIIMTASRALKTPTMSVPIVPAVSDRQAQRLMRDFTKLTLGEVLASKGGITVMESLQQDESGLWERAYQITLKFHPAERIKEAFGLTLEDIARVTTRSFIPMLSSAMRLELKRGCAEGDITNVTVLGGAASEYLSETTNDDTTPRTKKSKRDEDDYDDEVANEEDGVTGSRFGHKKEMASYGDMDDEEKEIAKTGRNTTLYDGDDSYGLDDDDSIVAMVTDEEDNDQIGSSNALKINRKHNTMSLKPLRVNPSARPLLMVNIVEQAAAKTVVRCRRHIDQAFVNNEVDGTRGRCLQTAGVNFEEIWKLDNQLVEHNKLISNDIWATRCSYGVEAARKSIVDQIRGVFAVYGISVDPRHLSLIADYMTYDGDYKPMNRIGMMSNNSTFLQMSFETTATFLTEAALNGYKENLLSPSANIVLGRPIRHGTGAFECLVKG